MKINLDGFDIVRQVLFYVLISLGYSGIFSKCGVKKLWAFIPCFREYHLSVCANREEDGRKLSVLAAIIYLFEIVTTFFYFSNGNALALIFIFVVAIVIAKYVYLFRIYVGLTEVFGRPKKWAFPLTFFEALFALLWGFSPRFKPLKKVENLALIDEAKTLGLDIETIKDGLTVNIKDRVVWDFFKRKVLLKDIHMCIPSGHMVLLLGGSGAGKTTYLNAITGYEKANATILLKEQNVYEEYAKMMYDIGFVPQQDLMRGSDTVAMTLSDAAALRLPSKVMMFERNKRIVSVLEQFGLTAVKNNLVDKLSGGQRKRLSIAMEFISDPSLFILDEPDSGLDGVVARGLFERLRAIANEGKIVVVITHTPDRVIDLFDDVIVLAKDGRRTGRLAYYGPVQEAYEFFGKSSMEEILLSINQKEEGGEGRADEFVEKYADLMRERVG